MTDGEREPEIDSMWERLGMGIARRRAATALGNYGERSLFTPVRPTTPPTPPIVTKFLAARATGSVLIQDDLTASSATPLRRASSPRSEESDGDSGRSNADDQVRTPSVSIRGGRSPAARKALEPLSRRSPASSASLKLPRLYPR